MAITNHRQIVFGEIERFLRKFKDLKDRTVLEIGAGDTIDFKQLFESLGMKYTSLDKISGGFMENMDFESESFDLIFSCHAFEHTTHPLSTLAECRRILKEGGVLFLITPYYCEHHVIKADQDHFFVLTDMQMERLFRATGIKTQSIYIQTSVNQFLKIAKKQDYNLISIGMKAKEFMGIIKSGK